MPELSFGHGWKWMTSDGIVTNNQAILHAIVMHVNANGAECSLYEGLDSSSGRLIGTFTDQANVSRSIDLKGLQCDRGIYIEIGADVLGVLVVYDNAIDSISALV